MKNNNTMYRIGLLTIIVALFSFKKPSISNRSSITIEQLSKKWTFVKYQYFFYSEKPPKAEQNDYIDLRKDGHFSSVSEGQYEEGQWTFDEVSKKILLQKITESGVLSFLIVQLTDEQLIMRIDDPSDADAKHLKLHFKN